MIVDRGLTVTASLVRTSTYTATTVDTVVTSYRSVPSVRGLPDMPQGRALPNVGRVIGAAMVRPQVRDTVRLRFSEIHRVLHDGVRSGRGAGARLTLLLDLGIERGQRRQVLVDQRAPTRRRRPHPLVGLSWGE